MLLPSWRHHLEGKSVFLINAITFFNNVDDIVGWVIRFLFFFVGCDNDIEDKKLLIILNAHMSLYTVVWWRLMNHLDTKYNLHNFENLASTFKSTW